MSIEDIPKHLQDNYELHEWRININIYFEEVIINKWTYHLIEA